LAELAGRALAQAKPEQADFGAALCVLCYLALANGSTYADKLALAERAATYAQQSATNPTVLRWQVSLTFVAGLLHLSAGNRDAARAAFEKVTQFDVRAFSPLLGTKTVLAAFTLGEMAVASGSEEDARSWWDQALSEVRRLLADIDWREVVGPEGNKQTFGLPELADMLLTAAKAVNGLSALRHGGGQPGLLWRLVHSTLDSRAELTRIDEANLRESLEEQQRYYQEREKKGSADYNELLQSKEWLEGQYRHLNEEVAQLGKMNMALTESRQWLEEQYHSLTAALSDSTATNSRLHTSNTILNEDWDALVQSKEWLDGQYHSLTIEVAELGNLNRALTESNQWLETQYQEVAKLGAANKALTESKHWLETQYHFLSEEIAKLGAEKEALVESKQWLDGQYYALTAALARSTAAYDELRVGNAEQVEANRALSGAVESLKEEVATAHDEISKLNEEIRVQAEAHRADAAAARARIEFLGLNPIQRAWVRFRSGRNKRGMGK
jgi:predicted nuclease with TOPRIM domain